MQPGNTNAHRRTQYAPTMHCPLTPGHHRSHWHVSAHHAHASYMHTASYSIHRHLLLGISTNDRYGICNQLAPTIQRLPTFTTHGEQWLPHPVSTGIREHITVHPQPFDTRRIQRRRCTSMPIARSCTTSRIVQKRFNIRNACLTCIIHSFPHPTFLLRIQSLRGSTCYSISFISYILLV